MHLNLPFEEAPINLCCPITLALYIDPVQTIKGQTYERAAIEDWFKTHNTDPMTGEALLTTDVFQDADMLSKCKQHACKSVSVRPIGGRGGRGIGRMEQGGRGGRGGRGAVHTLACPVDRVLWRRAATSTGGLGGRERGGSAG